MHLWLQRSTPGVAVIWELLRSTWGDPRRDGLNKRSRRASLGSSALGARLTGACIGISALNTASLALGPEES
eukprot:9362870-Alexandrium_andersonii.AAC.1